MEENQKSISTNIIHRNSPYNIRNGQEPLSQGQREPSVRGQLEVAATIMLHPGDPTENNQIFFHLISLLWYLTVRIHARNPSVHSPGNVPTSGNRDTSVPVCGSPWDVR